MNNTQRLAFWKTFCSLDGKNPENDCKLLSEKNTWYVAKVQIEKQDDRK